MPKGVSLLKSFADLPSNKKWQKFWGPIEKAHFLTFAHSSLKPRPTPEISEGHDNLILMAETQFSSDREAIDAMAQSYQDLKSEIAKVIVGQDDVVKTIIISLFSNGHSLLVGVPGLAKTLMVSTISEVLDLDFKRIQFTPDLMPSDITGSEILNEDRHFKFNRGPLFANIVLADEINRTPPKTQAALLEAMQERSVTVAGTAHPLPSPFFVLATQNPIEQEGTYPLPEAQLDRFMFNIPLDYPSYEEELEVVRGTTSVSTHSLDNILTASQILNFQQLIRKIPIAENVLEYAVSLASKTRPNTERATSEVNEYISWGAGPRASQYLVLGAKCHAAIQGKYSPDIEDVRAIANFVLRHRIVRNFKAEAEAITEEHIIKGLL
jgi:MoxR-like ATPase